MNGIRRRLMLAAAGIAAVPGTLLAQTAGRTYRIGVINVSNAQTSLAWAEAFVARLAELGFVEGKNLVVDRRSSEGRFESLPGLVEAVIAGKPDLIFAPAAPVTAVVKAATSSIPVVYCYVNDPVGLGFAKSLAKPGGNLTGLSNFSVEIAGKRIEMLKEISPKFGRLAIWQNTDAMNDSIERNAAERAAKQLGLRSIVLNARNADEYAQAAAATRKAGAEAVYIVSNPVSNIHAKLIVSLIAELKKPAVYWNSEFVVNGGLISYAADFADLARRAAGYAARILRGAKPSELPVEQPVRLELFLNMATARALGVTVPKSLLLRADRVIE